MERPLVVAGGRLLGVLSESTRQADRPGVIILNSGLVYRAGPGRLSVEVARRIAQMGFVTFRFDLAGIGDSEPPAQATSSVESALIDAHDVMDALGKQLGLKRFILFGLCSGAVHGHHIAAADPRVVGAVMLDGYIFHTARSRLTRALERFRPLRQLPRRAIGCVQRGFSVSRSPALSVEDDGFLPRWPAKALVARDLPGLLARRVALLMIYTGEWGAYQYEGQVAAALQATRHGGLITEVRMPSAEHLYLARVERNALLDTVARWLEQQPWERRPQSSA